MSFNMRSPAVKRLMREAEELKNPTELFFAQPLEDNIFEWHFTIRGPEETDFDGGIYHGRILLPAEYPMKPPSIILLTPTGRFKVHEKICLSISGHHPETWLPSWSIRTALLALIGFMPTVGEGAIGSLDYTTEERKALAKKSSSFQCNTCKINNIEILPMLTNNSQEISAEAKELASQINFKNNNKSDNKASEPSQSESTELRQRQPVTETVTSTVISEPQSQTITNSNNVANQQATESNRSGVMLFLILLGVVFTFLLIRRIYIMTESNF